MTEISIQDAQASLVDLIHRLSPGEEVVIMENNQPIARLVASPSHAERRLGTLQGSVLYIAPDFDAPLDEFKEY